MGVTLGLGVGVGVSLGVGVGVSLGMGVGVGVSLGSGVGIGVSSGAGISGMKSGFWLSAAAAFSIDAMAATGPDVKTMIEIIVIHKIFFKYLFFILK